MAWNSWSFIQIVNNWKICIRKKTKSLLNLIKQDDYDNVDDYDTDKIYLYIKGPSKKILLIKNNLIKQYKESGLEYYKV